jgi:hypothetical protein
MQISPIHAMTTKSTQHVRTKSKPEWLAAVLGGLLTFLALPVAAQTTAPIYATEDTFVLSPGPGNAVNYWDGARRNFGNMRSRHVAAATAHPGNNPANPAMGEFDVVARFYPSNTLAQLDAQYGVGRWRISGLALKLMTSDNVAGPGLFNAPGNAGQYNVCWMPADGGWVQGAGYINQGAGSHDPSAYPDNFTNLTYNSLQSILSTNPAVVLNTLNFVKQGILAPVTNSLTMTNQPFLDALMNARPTTLLFNAADDHVAFNFTSHLYGDDRDTNLYSPAIYVTVSPLPAPTAQVESIGEIRFLTLQFQRLSGVTNLTYTVLAASNLTQSSWSFVAGGTNGASMTGPGLIGEIDSPTSGLKNVTVRDLVPVSSTSSRFLKLRITK